MNVLLRTMQVLCTLTVLISMYEVCFPKTLKNSESNLKKVISGLVEKVWSTRSIHIMSIILSLLRFGLNYLVEIMISHWRIQRWHHSDHPFGGPHFFALMVLGELKEIAGLSLSGPRDRFWETEKPCIHHCDLYFSAHGSTAFPTSSTPKCHPGGRKWHQPNLRSGWCTWALRLVASWWRHAHTGRWNISRDKCIGTTGCSGFRQLHMCRWISAWEDWGNHRNKNWRWRIKFNAELFVLKWWCLTSILINPDWSTSSSQMLFKSSYSSTQWFSASASLSIVKCKWEVSGTLGKGRIVWAFFSGLPRNLFGARF